MPSLLFCGPKMAACGIVISIWGVIMLVRHGSYGEGEDYFLESSRASKPFMWTLTFFIQS